MLSRKVCCIETAIRLSHLHLTTFIGFDWDALQSGSVIVDVGGGIGAQSMAVAQNYPHLRIIVQDREQTVKDAVSVSINPKILCKY